MNDLVDENQKKDNQDNMQELQLKAKVSITKRKLDLTMVIVLILTALSTVLFAIMFSSSYRGVNWSDVFLYLAMFSPAFIYVAVLVILLIKDKKKLFWVHLVFIFLLSIAWMFVSNMAIMPLPMVFARTKLTLLFGIVGFILSMLTMILSTVFFIKIEVYNSKTVYEHLIFVLVLAVIWGIGSGIGIVMMSLGNLTLGIILNVVSVVNSIIAIIFIVTYIVKSKKYRSKNHEN